MIIKLNKAQAMAIWDVAMNAPTGAELHILSQDTSGNLIARMGTREFKFPTLGGHKDITPEMIPVVTQCPQGCNLSGRLTPCEHGWSLIAAGPEA